MTRFSKSESLIFPAALFNALSLTLIGNLWIPNIIGQANFSHWRQILTILAYAGLAHLGLADGLQFVWSKMRGLPNTSFILSVLPIILTISLLIFVLNGFNTGSWGYYVAILFISSGISPFFTNFLVSHGRPKELVLFYTIQPLLYLMFVEGLKVRGVVNFYLPILGQLVVIGVGFVFAVFVYSSNEYKEKIDLSIKSLLVKHRGAGLYITNLALISLYSFDRILAIHLLNSEDKNHYFFLSLFITLSSTFSMLISNIIFSRSVDLSNKFKNILRIFLLTMALTLFLLPDGILNMFVSVIYPRFSSSGMIPYILAAIIVLYFNILILPEARRHFIKGFLSITTTIMVVSAAFSLVFVKTSEELIFTYLSSLLILTLCMEILIIWSKGKGGES